MAVCHSGGMADQNQIAKLESLIAAIDNAILDIANGGQKVIVGDREFDAGDPKALLAYKKEIEGNIRELRGTTFRRVTFGRVS